MVKVYSVDSDLSDGLTGPTLDSQKGWGFNHKKGDVIGRRVNRVILRQSTLHEIWPLVSLVRHIFLNVLWVPRDFDSTKRGVG